MLADLKLRHRDFLRTFAIFKNFHPNELLLLAQNLKERHFEHNQMIFKEHDLGDSCFIIVFGSVGVIKTLPAGKYEPLALLKSGDLFGQLSLIDGQPRSATCVATSRSMLLELPKANFDRMFDTCESFAFRFQEYLTKVGVRQVRQANTKLSRLVDIARRSKSDQELQDIFGQMKDTMCSVKEMAVNLDEVTFDAPSDEVKKSVISDEMKQKRAMQTEEYKKSSFGDPVTPKSTLEIKIDNMDFK